MNSDIIHALGVEKDLSSIRRCLSAGDYDPFKIPQLSRQLFLGIARAVLDPKSPGIFDMVLDIAVPKPFKMELVYLLSDIESEIRSFISSIRYDDYVCADVEMPYDKSILSFRFEVKEHLKGFDRYVVKRINDGEYVPREVEKLLEAWRLETLPVRSLLCPRTRL